MQVMVLEQDQKRQAQLAQALMEKGFHVLCVESLDAAECFVRMDVVDVLVLGERVGGRLSHSLALLAECRNPMVSAILLTERSGPDMDEIFDLIPAVYAILGRDVAPRVVSQIVMAAITAQVGETPHARMTRRWQVAEAAGDVVEDADFADMVLRDNAHACTPADDPVPEAMVAKPIPAATAMALDRNGADMIAAGDAPARGEPDVLPAPATESASTRWFRSARAAVAATDAPDPASYAFDGPIFDGPVVAGPASLLTDLPVFVPVALMAGDAPRRRLHLG